MTHTLKVLEICLACSILTIQTEPHKAILGVWRLSSSTDLQSNRTHTFDHIISYHFHANGTLIITDTQRRERTEARWTLKSNKLTLQSPHRATLSGRIKFKGNDEFKYFVHLRGKKYSWSFTNLE